MKRSIILKTMLFACVAGFMASCSNDNYEGASPKEITANYSNIPNAGVEQNLSLTYSGDSLIGKSVKFVTWDSEKAELTLENILPHETEVTLKDVALQSDGKGGYTFSGSSTSPLQTTFSYKGSVEKGHLNLDLTDIKIPGNPIGTLKLVQSTYFETDSASTDKEGNTKTWQSMHSGIYFNSDNAVAYSAVNGLLGQIAFPVFNLLLNEVTFAQDGNITAGYAPLPKDFDFMTFMGDPSAFQHEPWQESPKNLATYFMADDTTMYVTPNVAMIMRQIQKDQATTRAGLSDLSNLKDIYTMLSKWSTTGLKLTFKPNPWKNQYQTVPSADESYYYYNRFEGDYVVYISKDEIQPLLTFIKSYLTEAKVQELLDKLPADQIPPMFKPMISSIVTQLLDGINKSNMLEIGLFFNKK